MNKLFPLFQVKKIVDFRAFSIRYTADGKEVPKKKHFEPRITLISPDNSVSITDLKNAQNISLRRELKLVKVQDVDSKTRRPVYKLMTNAEFHAEELEKRKEKQASRLNSFTKGEKLLTISSKIGEHDLMTSVKKMLKLLEKQYEVRVVVTSEGQEVGEKAENIFAIIEKNLKYMGNIVQKRSKGNSLRFQLLPLKNNNVKNGDTSSNIKNVNESNSNDNPNDRGPL